MPRLVGVRLLGHAETGSEDEAQIVQTRQPRRRVVRSEPFLAGSRLDPLERAELALLEPRPDELLVLRRGALVIRRRRREEPCEARVRVAAAAQLLDELRAERAQ